MTGFNGAKNAGKAEPGPIVALFAWTIASFGVIALTTAWARGAVWVAETVWRIF